MIYEPYLMHHGIKGQKWGVRNFQYVDGSLTAKGKMRYYDSTGKKISKHRAKLIEGYRQKGMNQEAAEKQAKKRVTMEKIMIGVGATAITAAAVYAAKKKIPEYVDRTVSKGTTLKRIEGEAGGKLHDVFYAARNKHDVNRYEGLLGHERNKQFGKAFQMDIGVNKDVKIASDRNARKVFEDLYKNNASFKNEVDSVVKLNGSKKKNYDKFNQMLVAFGREDQGLSSGKTFYNALKDKGYGAIRDMNDLKYSGYRAKDPLIIFDRGAAKVNSVRELNAADLAKKAGVENGKRLAGQYMEQYVKSMAPVGAVAGTAVSASYLARTSPKNIKVRKDQR